MSARRIGFVLLWALSLIVVAVFAQGQNSTQRGATDVRIKSGSDIGFRVERNGRNGVEGTLMVRINGEWVAAEPVERVKY
jgi:hypothetical protein